jgi:hypothetical protein
LLVLTTTTMDSYKYFATLLSLAVLGASTPRLQAETAKPINFEMTGTVLDSATMQPIEGAYVVASYQVPVVGPAASTSWCVKTRGMHTGKDGKFRFPVEKLDGYSPVWASAIKPGYYRGRPLPPDPVAWKKQSAEAYSGRDLLLNPQDPTRPQFKYGSGDEFCNHAATRQDASAGVEFLRIELSEYIRLGAGQQGINATRKMIERLESLPSRAASKGK